MMARAPLHQYEEYLFSTLGVTADGVWDDLRAPVTGINPPGAASDPDIDATDGMLLFDASSTELVYITQQMPHTWREGTAIRPHIHWAKTTDAAGAVAWQLEYKVYGHRDVYPALFTSLGIVSEPVSDPGSTQAHTITSFGEIDMTGYSISTMVTYKLSRIGGDAADTYAADARLFEFDTHYQKDAGGSLAEFTKQDRLYYQGGA